MMKRKNLFWVALAAPGILWLAVLFIVPFYAVLSIAMGKLDQLIEAPGAGWNPPFWISYMMRMLAWIDLLSTGGYVNKALGWVGISPVNWLSGNAATVILGLTYGEIPYLIMVLYAGLDRIEPALLEAGRDLGLGRTRTFWHVTLPLSRPAIPTGL